MVKSNNKGFVYLLSDSSGDFKIGITSGTIEKRIKSLQTGNAKEIFIIDYYQSEFYKQIETILHRVFKPKQSETRKEWFTLTTTDISNFKTKCEKIENNLLLIKMVKY